jgi:hypothetical protein
MTNTFGPEYAAIQQQMVTLHLTWNTYRQVFATSEARFKLLQEMVPGFAWVLHNTLLDAVVLGICRLSDKRNDVVKFEILVNSLIPPPDRDQLAWLKTQIAKIKQAVEAFKDHRDNRIAHNNPSYVLGTADVLSPFSRQTIEDALKLMRELMDKIKDWHDAGGTDFEVVVPGDAATLIAYLQQAHRLYELQDDYHLGRLSDEEIIRKLAVRGVPPMN